MRSFGANSEVLHTVLSRLMRTVRAPLLFLLHVLLLLFAGGHANRTKWGRRGL